MFEHDRKLTVQMDPFSHFFSFFEFTVFIQDCFIFHLLSKTLSLHIPDYIKVTAVK